MGKKSCQSLYPMLVNSAPSFVCRYGNIVLENSWCFIARDVSRDMVYWS
ncbi:hypothetical protein BVRB_3g049490 [Beta vulgaris subsp. vulgaris]|nr:hypothetical protein BVRB_3g049490 [Beta vulgaris subsp. vulgaris]